jgi:hypothetical protein
MGLSVSCDGCGRTVLGITTSLREVNGRNLCPQCAKNPDVVSGNYGSSSHDNTPTAVEKGRGKKAYKVFEHPQNRVEAVKQGWSWPAFFFTWIWALVKKMWAVGIVTAIVWFVIGSFFQWLATPPRGVTSSQAETASAVVGVIELLFGFVICFWFGLRGNKWREQNLVSRGYSLIGQVRAATPEGAVAKCRSGREPAREPQLEIIEEETQPLVRLRCTKCGLDKGVPRNKFGDRTGTLRVKCPKCKEPVPVNLGN